MDLKPSLRRGVAQRVHAARVRQTHESHCADVWWEHRIPIDAIRARPQSTVALEHVLKKATRTGQKVEVIAIARLLLPNVLPYRGRVRHTPRTILSIIGW